MNELKEIRWKQRFENLVNKLISDIINIYFPELKLLHDKLEKEV